MDYISDVLPELGVGRICQTTFAEYVLNATKLKLKLTDPDEKLELLTESETLNKKRFLLHK